MSVSAISWSKVLGVSTWLCAGHCGAFGSSVVICCRSPSFKAWQGLISVLLLQFAAQLLLLPRAPPFEWDLSPVRKRPGGSVAPGRVWRGQVPGRAPGPPGGPPAGCTAVSSPRLEGRRSSWRPASFSRLCALSFGSSFLPMPSRAKICRLVSPVSLGGSTYPPIGGRRHWGCPEMHGRRKADIAGQMGDRHCRRITDEADGGDGGRRRRMGDMIMVRRRLGEAFPGRFR